jgi:3-methyl-2-oxobutanoate hydroxymethyltransferase
VLAEARATDAAGAFAWSWRLTPQLGAEVTAAVSVPTIGIGAGGACDGQIPMTEDMLGLFNWTPKFVRRYADLRTTIDTAVCSYAADVRAGAFPAEAELYRLKSG